ncbi:MAG: hypothetical protein R6U44_02835 [Archaeoglobaceae archaeon]
MHSEQIGDSYALHCSFSIGSSCRTWDIHVKKMRTKKKLIPLFLILIVAGVSIAYLTSDSTSSQPTTITDTSKKAIIIDQLNLTYPNQTFVREATVLLEKANYEVDYIAGKNVTVDFYRNLPSKNYDLIVFRVHSSASEYGDKPVVLFSSENYTQDKYQLGQVTDSIQKVYYDYGEEYYFAISPKFVNGLDGNFDNATIIHMGCEGLEQDNMAKAFVGKGAKVFIGWSGDVNAYHSDTATLCFLKEYTLKGRTVEHARLITMGEVGSDPVYKSELWYYPEEAGYERIN